MNKTNNDKQNPKNDSVIKLEINKCRYKVVVKEGENAHATLEDKVIHLRQDDDPDSLFIIDAEAVRAGTEIYAMPAKDKNEEYDRIAKKTGVYFIFDDNAPARPVYSVPYLCIFAK